MTETALNRMSLVRIALALERIADVLEFQNDRDIAQRKVAQVLRMEDIERQWAKEAAK